MFNPHKSVIQAPLPHRSGVIIIQVHNPTNTNQFQLLFTAFSSIVLTPLVSLLAASSVSARVCFFCAANLSPSLPLLWVCSRARSYDQNRIVSAFHPSHLSSTRTPHSNWWLNCRVRAVCTCLSSLSSSAPSISLCWRGCTAYCPPWSLSL